MKSYPFHFAFAPYSAASVKVGDLVADHVMRWLANGVRQRQIKALPRDVRCSFERFVKLVQAMGLERVLPDGERREMVIRRPSSHKDAEDETELACTRAQEVV